MHTRMYRGRGLGRVCLVQAAARQRHSKICEAIHLNFDVKSQLTSTSLIFAAFRRIRIPEIVTLLIAIALPAISQNAISQKKMDKSAVDTLYHQGLRSLQKGDLAAARAAFEKVVQLAPNAPEGYNSLGWGLMNTGNLDEAIAQLRTAVKLKADFVEAHINLANALAARRKGKDAIEDATNEARAAVKLAPSSSEAHRTLGRLLSFQQD